MGSAKKRPTTQLSPAIAARTQSKSARTAHAAGPAGENLLQAAPGKTRKGSARSLQSRSAATRIDNGRG